MNSVFLTPLKKLVYALDDGYQRYIYERPNPAYRRALARSIPDPDFFSKAERFCQKGILILPSYFSGEMLKGMQEEFNRWAAGIAPDSIGRIRLTEKDGIFLHDSIGYSKAALDPFLTALVSYYWGKPIWLTHSYGFRLEPEPGGKEIGPFQWHHDAHRKQVKVYLLLTDVPPEGQRMDYLPGTHQLWHRFKRGSAGYEETRLKQEAVLAYGEPLRCVAPEGSVILFDTNGLHRGNQTPSVRRDAWVFQYTAGRHRVPTSGVHPQALREQTDQQRKVARIQPSPVQNSRSVAVVSKR